MYFLKRLMRSIDIYPNVVYGEVKSELEAYSSCSQSITDDTGLSYKCFGWGSRRVYYDE